MRAVAGIDRLPRTLGRLFVVVGVFDGLHRGHHYLLAHLRREATRRAARPAVITFDAHPDEIILGAAPPLLCDPVERLARLRNAGVEVAVVQHFDAALRITPYGAFIQGILDRVDLAGFLMTPDAAFGHERRGTPAAVAVLGDELGFDVVVVPPLQLGGRPVRSQEIRSDIAAGDLAGARFLLGRPFAVAGAADGATREASTGMTVMQFAVPPALPPDGRYRVTLEPAWDATGRTDQPRRAEALVEAGTVYVPGGRPNGPTGDEHETRLRIAFVGPAGRSSSRPSDRQ